MKYIIRKATREDLPHVIDLASEMVKVSVSPFRDVTPEQVKKFRKDDLQCLYEGIDTQSIGIFIAETEGKNFIGHVIVMANNVESSTGEQQGYIFDVSIRNNYQRMGIGENLMKTAEEFCQKRGMKYMALNVTSSNLQAHNFYLKHGYSDERIRMVKRIDIRTERK